MAMYPCLSLPSLSFPSVSGSLCTFNSQYAGLPLKSHKIALTATQSGSGTPSPDNVRPINGYSAINIGAVSKNFLESNQDLIKAANGGANTWTDNKKTIGNIEVTLLDDGGINLNGTASSNTVIMLHTRFAVLDYPSTMKMYIGTQSSINGLSFRISSGDLPGSQLICTNPSTPITIPDIKMNNADVFIFVNGTTQLTNVNVYPMILLSTETDINYVPFNGTYTTISIGSTVYGGEYDARTGVLTATHGVVDLGNLNWERRSNADYYYFRNMTNINNIKGGVAYQVGDIRCSIYEAVQSAFSADFVNYKMFLWTDGKIYLRNDDYTDANDFKTDMSGINLVYELATPTTIQLPPCPIDTLLGENNIWADTGDTTLQYSKFG